MSLSQLSPADLDALVSVADTGSFRRSAELLGVSQSTVSSRISHIEDVLGTTMFHRSTRRVVITDAGERFRRRVVAMIVETRDLLAEFKDTAQLRRGRLIVGATASVAAGLLPGVIGRFQRSWPAIDVVLHDDFFGQALDRVLRGEVDLAVVPAGGRVGDLVCEPLISDVFRLAVPATHRLAGRHSITLADVAEERLLSMPTESAAWATLSAASAAAGLDYAPVFKTRDSATMMALVRQGFGIAFVPDLLVPGVNMKGISLIPTSDVDLRRSIVIIHARDRKLSSAAQVFCKHLQESAQAWTPTLA